MAQTSTDLWNVEQRRRLDEVLNRIIPASADGRLPAAGDLRIGDFVAARVADEALQALFEAGLATAASTGTDTPEAVRALENQAPEFFAALLRYTYMGYYSRPDVRAGLGLSPKPVHPDGYDVPREPAELLDQLTAPVRGRGKCYRDI